MFFDTPIELRVVFNFMYVNLSSGNICTMIMARYFWCDYFEIGKFEGSDFSAKFNSRWK